MLIFSFLAWLHIQYLRRKVPTASSSCLTPDYSPEAKDDYPVPHGWIATSFFHLWVHIQDSHPIHPVGPVLVSWHSFCLMVHLFFLVFPSQDQSGFALYKSLMAVSPLQIPCLNVLLLTNNLEI